MKTATITFELDDLETDRWFAPDGPNEHPTTSRDVFRFAIRERATSLARAAGAEAFKIVAANGNTCDKLFVPTRPEKLRALTAAEETALRSYAKYHGRYWKRDLGIDWERACADLYPSELRSEMQSLRNTHGPSWLARYQLPKLAWTEAAFTPNEKKGVPA